MKKAYQRVLSITCVFLAISLLYIPFRLFAQKFNIVSISYLGSNVGEIYHSDNFYHWFSILVWPTYSFIIGFLPLFCVRLLRLRWYYYIFVCVAVVFLWADISVLDEWLRIPGGGLLGYNTWSSKNLGINTTHISVMMCPLALLGGAILGFFVAKIRIKRTAKTKDDAKP